MCTHKFRRFAYVSLCIIYTLKIGRNKFIKQTLLIYPLPSGLITSLTFHGFSYLPDQPWYKNIELKISFQFSFFFFFGGGEFHPLFLRRSLYIINTIQTVVSLSTEFMLQILKHVHHISDDIKSKLLLKACLSLFLS